MACQRAEGLQARLLAAGPRPLLASVRNISSLDRAAASI